MSLLGVAILLGGVVAACGPIGGKSKSPTKSALDGSRGSASPKVVASPHAIPASPAGGTPAATPASTPVPAPPPLASPPAVPSPTKTPTRRASATGVPVAAESSTASPPAVANCTPPDPLPPVTLHGVLETTDSGVHLHNAPGEHCEIIDTLDTATQLTAESGPVRADQLLWIKVNVNGEEGWLAAQYVAPAGSAPPTATAG